MGNLNDLAEQFFGGPGNINDLMAKAYANGGYISAPALTSAITYPVSIVHRMGGADGAGLAPENTLEAARASAAAGFGFQFQVYLAKDGTLLVMHDTTIDRTTTGSGNVADQTVQSWQTLSIDAGSYWLAGWPSLKPPTFEQVLREFGGRVPIVPECMNTGSGAAIVALVRRFGLEKYVIVSSSTVSELSAAKAVGIKTLYYTATDWSTDVDTAIATGADWIHAITGNATYMQSLVAACHAAGKKAFAGADVNRHLTYSTYLGYGVDGFLVADPLYVTDALPVVSSDSFALKTWWPGSPWTGSRGAFFGTNRHGWGSESSASSARYPFVVEGDFNPFLAAQPQSWTLSWTVTFDALGSDTSRNSVLAVLATDTAFDANNLIAYDTTGHTMDGIYCICRATGQLALFKIANGVQTQLGSSISTAAISAGGTATLQLIRTATTVEFKRTDVAGTTGAQAESTLFGTHLHRGQQSGSGTTNTGLQTSCSGLSISTP